MTVTLTLIPSSQTRNYGHQSDRAHDIHKPLCYERVARVSYFLTLFVEGDVIDIVN